MGRTKYVNRDNEHGGHLAHTGQTEVEGLPPWEGFSENQAAWPRCPKGWARPKLGRRKAWAVCAGGVSACMRASSRGANKEQEQKKVLSKKNKHRHTDLLQRTLAQHRLADRQALCAPVRRHWGVKAHPAQAACTRRMQAARRGEAEA